MSACKPTSKTAIKYKEKGNAFFKKGEFDAAILNYTYATECDPENPIFYTNRSVAYLKLGKFEKSLRDAKKALKKDSTWHKGYYRAGMACVGLKQYKEAQEFFKKALEYGDERNKKQYEIALTDSKRALRKGMSRAEIVKSEGNELFTNGKYDESLKKYTTAISMCSSSENKLKAALYCNRAACNRQLYLHSKVIDDCSLALKLDPTLIKAHIRRAMSYEATENWKDALADWEKAALQNSSAQNAIQGQARCRKNCRVEEARKKKEKAKKDANSRRGHGHRH